LPVAVHGDALVVDEPPSRPIRCTVSKSRSVSSLDAFFGQAIHSPSAGPSERLSLVKRFARSALEVVKKTRTAAPGFAPSFAVSGVPE
jgi:hypothetical protein